MDMSDKIIDEKGTTQKQARDMLLDLTHKGFSDSLERAATALGRPTDEIADFIYGRQEIDEDALMKIRGIADERGVEL